MTQARRVSIEYNFDGWPTPNSFDPHGRCSVSVIERKLAGLPACSEVAEFRVTSYGRNWAQTSHYCYEHLPEDLQTHPAAAKHYGY